MNNDIFVFAINIRGLNTKKPVKNLPPIVTIISNEMAKSTLSPDNQNGYINFGTRPVDDNSKFSYREVSNIYPIAYSMDRTCRDGVSNHYCFAFFKRPTPNSQQLVPYGISANDPDIAADQTPAYTGLKINTCNLHPNEAKICRIVLEDNIVVDEINGQPVYDKAEVKFAFGVCSSAKANEIELPKVTYDAIKKMVQFEDTPASLFAK